MHLLYNVISRQVSSDSQTLEKDLLSCKNTNWFRNRIRTSTSKIPSSRSFHTALFSWVIVSACIMELIFSSISSRLISEGCNTKRNILNKYCRHVMQYTKLNRKMWPQRLRVPQSFPLLPAQLHHLFWNHHLIWWVLPSYL